MYLSYLNRWDVSKDHSLRTLSSVCECLKSKEHKGCINAPLFNIDISDIVLDELHLMLRVTDVLIRNIIWAVVHKDLTEVHQRKPAKYLETLVEKIKSCGITFKVFHTLIYKEAFYTVHIGLENER